MRHDLNGVVRSLHCNLVEATSIAHTVSEIYMVAQFHEIPDGTTRHSSGQRQAHHSGNTHSEVCHCGYQRQHHGDMWQVTQCAGADCFTAIWDLGKVCHHECEGPQAMWQVIQRTDADCLAVIEPLVKLVTVNARGTQAT